MLPLCIADGIAVVPWSPLARGRLTRAREDTSSTAHAAADEVWKALCAKAQEADRMVVGRVGEIAEPRGILRAQAALAWPLHKKA
ncbi:aldo/keto reductase [Bosea psychrotolerans]|uniref:Aldo/keto reductase family protein n=1 Tax=Bosea psychrotolerans TaxID=1871628 RepID=A0A2S4LWI5_9HYPH|nr:aldo/keto reductase [Bosea psychrotolerans]POR46811.1 aldo/keto reductase family protein [Bosea psychrotolerans]